MTPPRIFSFHTKSLVVDCPMSQAAKPRILVADDRADIVKALQTLLRHQGYGVLCANRPEPVMACRQTTWIWFYWI